MASTISAGTTAGTALNIQSDTTGNLAFKTGASNVTAMTLDSNQNVTFANNVTYTGNIQGATITATTGFSGSGASLSALNASNVSTGTLSTAVLPTVPVASGGTGLTTTPANGAIDIGNGTGFTRTTLTAGSGISITNGSGSISIAATGGGTVTSVATGNGLSGGTITTSGTLTIAAPSWNSVGSYTCASIQVTYANTVTAGNNYAAGTTNLLMQAAAQGNTGAGAEPIILVNGLSGTWKWMSATFSNGSGGSRYPLGIAVRVS